MDIMLMFPEFDDTLRLDEMIVCIARQLNIYIGLLQRWLQ